VESLRMLIRRDAVLKGSSKNRKRWELKTLIGRYHLEARVQGLSPGER